MREVFDIISTLSRMSKEICFNIQSERIYLVGSECKVNGIPQIWSDIGKHTYFSEYQLDGMDKTDHLHILFTANTVKLVVALSLLRGDAAVTYTKWKLTKKQFPCLSVDIEVSSSHTSETRLISHDIPVTIIPIRDWPEYAVPSVPNINFSLRMPSLRSLRSVVDNIKKYGSSLTVYSTSAGELSLVVENILATITSRYSKLEVIKFNLPDNLPVRVPTNVNKKGNEEITCRVQTKQLAIGLASIQLQDMQMYCNVTQDRSFKIVIEVRPNVFINYVLWQHDLWL